MEYVFGTQGNIEILKTKGDAHTDLMGFHQVERSSSDQTITDQFRVVRKIDSKEDVKGSCYDWYEIDHHFRMIDKTGPLVQQAAENAAAAENAVCELDANYDQRMSAVENALCELDERMNNGGKNE